MPYIAYDAEENTVCGVGNSPAEAIKEAEYWFFDYAGKPSYFEIEKNKKYCLRPENELPQYLHICEATKELSELFREKVGSTDFIIIDGIADVVLEK